MELYINKYFIDPVFLYQQSLSFKNKNRLIKITFKFHLIKFLTYFIKQNLPEIKFFI